MGGVNPQEATIPEDYSAEEAPDSPASQTSKSSQGENGHANNNNPSSSSKRKKRKKKRKKKTPSGPREASSNNKMNGVPLFISIPKTMTTTPTSPLKTDTVRRRFRHSISQSHSHALQLSLVSRSRWISCNTATAQHRETDKQDSSKPVVPPRLPRRLGSNVSNYTFDDDHKESPSESGAVSRMQDSSNDFSPKIPRRSWTLPGDTGSLLVHSGVPVRENQSQQNLQDQQLESSLSRIYSAPALTQSVVAAAKTA